MIKDLVWV